MTTKTLARVIDETFAYCSTLHPIPHIDFIWHGGEPLIAGIEFFQNALQFQAQSKRAVTFHNSLQTSGILLDSTWVVFLKENGFRVSVSIDGPRDVHNATRHYKSGRGSFDEVLRGIDLLRGAAIPFGVCVVISRANRTFVNEIYDFLTSERLPFNVIPLTRSGDGLANYDDLGLEPHEYADPWIAMYDRWYDSAGSNYVYSSDFVFKTRAILVGEPQDCIAQKVCSTAHISTDPDGNVFPCATLSADPDWCYGNLLVNTLSELMAGEVAQRAVNRQVDPHCVNCKWRHVCHGGCMQRAIKFFGTHNTRDYYCESLYRIYEHIESRLRTETRVSLDALPNATIVDSRPSPPIRPLQQKSVKHLVRGSFIPLPVVTS
jgi:uncharacterized protein